MLSIQELKRYGANTRAGTLRCMNDESFYLGMVEMLINDAQFELLAEAVRVRNLQAALHAAYALSDKCHELALVPIAEQFEKMIMCLLLQGDGAVLDKQLSLVMMAMERLRKIDAE